MRFLPGKMTEGTKLLEETLALTKKKYEPFPPVRKYTPWLGGGNLANTIIVEVEFDSLTQMAEYFEKAMADPEMMETNSKWEALLESDKEELLMEMQ
jgi:hypothetical protein